MSTSSNPTSNGGLVHPGALVAGGVSKVIDPVTLLHPVDVSLSPGHCLVVRGRNGTGKTTLLRILAGVIAPTTGSVTLGGNPVDERDPMCRKAIGALLGAPAAYPDLTLRDHLTLIDATWGGDPGSCEDRVTDQLSVLEIDHLDERFPHELSSGQGQLFRLALTLFRPARVLVLDEPEQRLDTDKRAIVAGLLSARRAAGDSLIVACHDPEMTERIGDSILDLAMIG